MSVRDWRTNCERKFIKVSSSTNKHEQFSVTKSEEKLFLLQYFHRARPERTSWRLFGAKDKNVPWRQVQLRRWYFNHLQRKIKLKKDVWATTNFQHCLWRRWHKDNLQGISIINSFQFRNGGKNCATKFVRFYVSLFPFLYQQSPSECFSTPELHNNCTECHPHNRAAKKFLSFNCHPSAERCE